VLHFSDNYLNIEDYGGPNWITKGTVLRFWLFMTLFAVMSYYYYQTGKLKLSYYTGLFYCGCCLFSLGHYYVNPPSFYRARIHLLLIAETIPAFILGGYHIWLNKNPLVIDLGLIE